MPNSIETYFQAMLDAAENMPLVSASNIVLDKRTNHAGLIRGDLYFIDASRLHFRELVEVQEFPVRLMYSYHYQGGGDELIFRYDDTPHYPDLPGFPHHKHVQLESRVTPSQPPDLHTVLAEITELFLAKM